MASHKEGTNTDGIEGHQTSGNRVKGHDVANPKRILIAGGGAVGCVTALKLGQAGIEVDIIEKLPATSTAPRACGYFGAVQFFLKEIGVYDLIREEGFVTRGLCWRKMPKEDGKGGKRLGDLIAAQPLCAPDDASVDVGAGLLNLPQADLNKLCLREALKTGHVRVHFSTELVSITQNEKEGVMAVLRDVETGEERNFEAAYLVGADGARSVTRKALNLPFPGHTWPERIITTNVLIQNIEDPLWHTYYLFDRIHYVVATPLEEPVLGKTTLWRYAIAADPNDNRPDDELLADTNILKHYERVIPGPRPLEAVIQARAIYRIHQRLAPTLRRGNCLLAGDAAHVNNPFGALGLNTGMLDADAVAQALIMILNEGRQPAILDIYSDERRKVFQSFVDPTSTQNKLRVHSNDEATAAQDDWYLRMMAKGPTQEQLAELMQPYFETWRTDMRKFTKDVQ